MKTATTVKTECTYGDSKRFIEGKKGLRYMDIAHEIIAQCVRRREADLLSAKRAELDKQNEIIVNRLRSETQTGFGTSKVNAVAGYKSVAIDFGCAKLTVGDLLSLAQLLSSLTTSPDAPTITVKLPEMEEHQIKRILQWSKEPDRNWNK